MASAYPRALAAIEGADAAIEWLEAAYRQRHPDLVTINLEAAYAKLRSDPRLQDLVRRIGLRPQNVSAAGCIGIAEWFEPNLRPVPSL